MPFYCLSSIDILKCVKNRAESLQILAFDGNLHILENKSNAGVSETQRNHVTRLQLRDEPVRFTRLSLFGIACFRGHC